MFFKSNKVKFIKQDFDSLNEDERVLPIQKLIGGTVYYPNYFEIITSRHFSQKGPSFDAKRAFYHKVELKQHKNNQNMFVVGDSYPLFSVLYYGDIRPDRYDAKHIYDTSFITDADVDGTKYVTFDILSIFSNILNPWHTIERALGAVAARDVVGEDDNKKYVGYENADFDVWKKICEIEIGSNYVAPNSMLPFYSVDIMLQYLKYSISFDIFIDEPKDDNNLAWEALMPKEKNNLKKLLDNTKNNVNNLDEKTLNDFVSSDLCNKIDIPEENIKILQQAIANYKIIYNQKYNTLYSRLNVVDSYRDFVIGLILDTIKGNTREKELLIKSLHKINTCSEIAEHLVSVLYRDTYRAKTVRAAVQDAVHSNEFVHYYYNKLWNNTKRMLDIINVNILGNIYYNMVDVYENIYNNAIKCFVMAPQEVNIN